MEKIGARYFIQKEALKQIKGFGKKKIETYGEGIKCQVNYSLKLTAKAQRIHL